MANAFKELGLTPEILRLLKDDDKIRPLVKANYRALSKLLHPDKGGSNQEFVRLSKAMAVLEDPITFHSAKREYLLPLSSRVKKLTAEVEAERAKVRVITSRLLDYIQEMVLAGGFPLPNHSLIVTELAPFKGAKINPEKRFIHVGVDKGRIWTQTLEYYGQTEDSESRKNGAYTTAKGHLIVVRGEGNYHSSQEWVPSSQIKYPKAVIVGSYLSPIGSTLNRSQLGIEGLSVSFEETNPIEFYRIEDLLSHLELKIIPNGYLILALTDFTPPRFSVLGKIYYIL